MQTSAGPPCRGATILAMLLAVSWRGVAASLLPASEELADVPLRACRRAGVQLQEDAPCIAEPLGWPLCAEEGDCLFTSSSLRLFTGSVTEPTILVSVVSYVFNVTSAPHHYGHSGSYPRLAGNDVSRTLATMSMEEEDLSSQLLTDLTEAQWEELFGWIDKFQEKYPLVGRLLGWRPGVTFEDINARSGFSLRPPPESD